MNLLGWQVLLAERGQMRSSPTVTTLNHLSRSTKTHSRIFQGHHGYDPSEAQPLVTKKLVTTDVLSEFWLPYVMRQPFLAIDEVYGEEWFSLCGR